MCLVLLTTRLSWSSVLVSAMAAVPTIAIHPRFVGAFIGQQVNDLHDFGEGGRVGVIQCGVVGG